MSGLLSHIKQGNFFRAPFPRPKRTGKNVFWLFLISIICSVFILLFKPFNIKNQTGELYVDLLLFSLGLVFFLSIYIIEFLIPWIFPKPFKKWTLGKAILWYTFSILFVGAIMFLYKGFLGGFRDFTWIEYFFVIGRVLGISIIVSFFVLGIFSYINRRQFSLLSSNESYVINAPNAKPLRVNLNQIMYIVSDDNYVDIHLEVDGKRKKEVFRSSLKNIESQIINPVSPIYKCHRKYLINIKYFEVQKISSRSMVIVLQKYDDEIPVSKQYAEQINSLLQIRH